MEKIMKLLMLEDSVDDAALIIAILKQASLYPEVRLVDTRDDFKKALIEFVPDIILSDHQLLQFNSIDALKITRENSSFIPFILVTGFATEEFAASIIKAGADDYLLKNNLKRLPTAIVTALEKKINIETLERTEQEKQRAEQELKTAHQRLLFHLENAPLGFIESDHDLRIKSWSKRAEEIFGWSEAESVDTAKFTFSHVFKEDLPWVSHVAQQLASGNIESNKLQFRSYKKDGSVIWCEWFNSVLKNHTGEVITVMSLVQDISEQKRNEEEIRNLHKKAESDRQRISSVLNTLPASIALLDREGIIIDVNKGWIDFAIGNDYQNEDYGIGLNYIAISNSATGTDGEMGKTIALGIEEVLNGKRKDFSMEYPCHSPTEDRWFRVVVTPLKQKGDGAVVMHINITEQKAAKHKLEVTLNRFMQAEEIAHLGHWESNLSTRKTTLSDETYRIFGLEPGSIEPTEDFFYSHTHPDDRDMVIQKTQYAMQTLTPFSYYNRIVRENGITRNVYSIAQFEFDKAGKSVCIYGILLDVTELAEKQQRIEVANQELETFIYKAYHDLRSPIVSILGIVNIAMLEIHDTQAQQYFKMIGDTSEKQNKMLKALVKGMAMRERQVIIESVDLRELLDEVIDAIKAREEDRCSRIKFEIISEISEPIQTDKELILDILNSLIENSVLYRNEITPHIKITMQEYEAASFSIAIEDNGAGIAEDVKPNIFDMFFRGNASSKGSGLGLYFVKYAIEKLGGTIELYSEDRKGSCFKIKFKNLTHRITND